MLHDCSISGYPHINKQFFANGYKKLHLCIILKTLLLLTNEWKFLCKYTEFRITAKQYFGYI